MITIENAELFLQGSKALLTFHEEDAPAVLGQISQAHLQELPDEAEDKDELMLVIEGEVPAGPIVVAFGPMSGSTVRGLHHQVKELTVCALGAKKLAYGFFLEPTKH